ncbi:MAG: hypothetical protein TREMPRED_003953 [Tremellales sp. Tagirdzhanova-0007]|nr:MAG: hypothetical protein TREMPRED_003953 [Tremellales sp. Tagirdzhanova-0007]
MSLRTKILHHSLHLLPTHSFTRQTLSLALSALPSSHPDHRADPTTDAIIDTLFGAGVSAPGKALVEAWENEGIERMVVDEGPRGLGAILGDRLSWSADVGDHLVEAYALLASPATTSSIPFPSLPTSILNFLPNLNTPLYTPPSTIPPAPLSPIDDAPTSSSRSVPPQLNQRLPLLSLNPLGPLTYAWRIADAALSLTEKHRGLRKGVMNEPIGSGPEWYTSRLGVSLVYLAAEASLLHPHHGQNASPGESAENPRLTAAIQALGFNMRRYESMNNTAEQRQQGLGGSVGYAQFLGKSLAGLIRSRGW